MPGTILNLYNVLTPLNLTVAYEVGATIIFIILLGNQDTEVLSHLSKVTQPLRDRAREEGGNLVPKPELLIFAIYCPWACLCFSYSLPQLWLTPFNHTLSLSSAVCWSRFLPWCDLSYAYLSYDALLLCPLFWKSFHSLIGSLGNAVQAAWEKFLPIGLRLGTKCERLFLIPLLTMI